MQEGFGSLQQVASELPAGNCATQMTKNNNRTENLEQQVAELKEANQALLLNQQELKQQLESVTKYMEEILVTKGKEPVPPHTPIPQTPSSGLLPTSSQKHHENPNPTLKTPKVDFPKFTGDNPRKWLRKCHKFFLFNPMSDYEKILLAAMHMEDLADSWYLDYVEGKEGMGWDRFSELVLQRFSFQKGENLVGQFNKLKQTSTVSDYAVRFEELRAFMISMNRTLSEEYFIHSFVSGLKEEISQMVEMFNPTSLADAIHLAKKQETLVELLGKGSKNSKSFIPGNMKNWKSNSSKPEKLPPVKRLSPEEMESRKKKGLCFNCDEPYHLGHKCKRVFVILGEEGESSDSEEEEIQPVQVSVSTLAGQAHPDTIKLIGHVGNRAITILIDTGSTHSFLDPNTARELGCEIEYSQTLLVTVADGGKIQCDAKCSHFTWEMGGHQFSAGMNLLALGGCDVIIGVDTFRNWGSVTFNVDKQSIKIKKGPRKIVLQGVQPDIKLSMISGKSLIKMIRKKKSPIISCLCMVSTISQEQQTPHHLEFQVILDKYQHLFKEPTTLPPVRSYDHKVPLKEGATPFKQSPYRYPYIQKEEIEKLVTEMLRNGIIQPSNSPFSSPVLLVKKRDGSWRFCVDYRKLNSLTIRDSFPIPLIEDLLDELGGSIIFSKIDLRAGYHQIRMNALDISKTAFVTSSGLYEFKVMPFGLTNAPATFQSLMNQVFKEYLRKFVLVFFDDILVYSQSLGDHKQHLELVFDKLNQNQLFAKLSKCSFGQERIEYLGHIISKNGVEADPSKIQSMVEWPFPKSLRSLRGFLGLTGYYRKFVRNYGTLAKPLTELTKKGKFQWTEEAQLAFQTLKTAMTTTPVLKLPDFSKTFILETDACYAGLGAVLMQEGHHIAYFSKALGSKSLGLSVYEKELLALISAVEKWRPYLLQRPFIIRTDQQSLKYLLEQKISTPLQHKYLTKLLGFQFTIEYKRGRENKVADALSRQMQDEGHCQAITTLQPLWMEEVRGSYKTDQVAQEVLAEQAMFPYNLSLYHYQDRILRYKGRLYVGESTDLRTKIIQLMHGSSIGGHCGIHGTAQRVKNIFLWPKLNEYVQQIVSQCHICQVNKHQGAKTPGLLQPLPVPDQAWKHLTMDFIEQLPTSGGKNVIWVVVDRFTKYAHFFALSHPFTASHIAHLFIENIYKLHGLPCSIISDRDKIFTSLFWKELLSTIGIQQLMSTAYHPQTDGQTERVNQCLEMYLRCMCGSSPKKWVGWLSMAEWWYNTNYHSSIAMTPFEALYGYKPTHLALDPYLQPTSVGVEEILTHRQQISQHLKQHLTKAQERMRHVANKHRRQVELTVGDYVYLKLRPYRQLSIRKSRLWRLSPKFAGPFQIIEKIGEVAYKLALPTGVKIHPVFHVSLLKKRVGPSDNVTSSIPTFDEEGKVILQPVAILARRLAKKNNVPVPQVLIQWAHLPREEATWADYHVIIKQFPNIEACGQA